MLINGITRIATSKPVQEGRAKSKKDDQDIAKSWASPLGVAEETEEIEGIGRSKKLKKDRAK
jgi:hypothetical protein